MTPSRMRTRRLEALKARDDKCKMEPGVFRPSVDVRRCEGKGDCVAVCPNEVFVVRPITDDAFAALPLLTKLKLWAHGRQTAYTPNAETCQACGLCVLACPERAIRLVRSTVQRDDNRSSAPPSGR